MEQEKYLTEKEFKRILVAQLYLAIDTTVTIQTLATLLAARGLVSDEEMSRTRKLVESHPKTLKLLELLQGIEGPDSIVDILKKFEGTLQ